VQKLNQVYIKSVVKKALEEDLRPRGDITTSLINSKNKIIKARIIAKQDGVIAGLEFCKTAFKLIGRETIFTKKVSDGKKIKKNKVIAYIKARTKTILTAERTALNFLNHASGIATITNQLVKKISKKTKICCTRKTTPNLRTLEKYAVKKGGGYNHRYNLSDEILIKDNHISASNNLRELVKKAIKTKKIVTVEVESINQRTRDGGAEIVKYLEKGSAYYAPAASGVEMAISFLNDEKKVLPCAAHLNGEYGIKNVYAGVPVLIGNKGVEKIEEIQLDEKEKKEFLNSVNAVEKLWEAAIKIDPELNN